jgi:AraC family transcriptional regulator of adaptative response/methylated-DNA-[protein]-cysteine methyltransferase
MNHTPHSLSAETCWQAVLASDRAYDGRFVLAVRTTGIYCRPSCPARPPLRQNVTFYPDCAAAEAAGFRPCKRCSPHKQAEEAAVVQRVCGYIDTHLDSRLTLDELGGQAHLSPTYLQRVFKRVMGISPRQYTAARRRDSLRQGLQDGGSVTGALYDAGYGSISHLYEGAASPLGMSPTVYRQGGTGMEIHYTIVESALGYLLVAGTEKGICAVRLADTPDELENGLHATYPAAERIQADGSLGEWVAALVRHLDGQQPHLELPLDVRATAFQQRVWQELQRIPYGETRTYSQVAAAIGNPKAVRAVGSACANNPVAVIVPCHRVVRADGGLGGYRWGIARKERLLAVEHRGRDRVFQG